MFARVKLYVSLSTNTYLEWELVERVDFLQIIQDEVEQRGPRRSWAVVFPGFIDLFLCHFCLLHLKIVKRGGVNTFMLFIDLSLSSMYVDDC